MSIFKVKNIVQTTNYTLKVNVAVIKAKLNLV